MTGPLSSAELADVGFARFGSNVRIDRTVAFFGAEHLHIGSDVRIDCFCVITAGPEPVSIGDNVHISAAVHIFGGGGVEIANFCAVSSRVAIFSVNDDYTEGHLTNPTVPDDFRKVKSEKVTLLRHSIIGSGSVVLPGVTVGLGAAVGALTLVNRSVPDYELVGGVPFRSLGRRNEMRLAELEARYRQTKLT